jgi:ribosomal protein S6--L-glutamate ligase
MGKRKTIGIYLPVKDKSQPRDYIHNPGCIDQHSKENIIEKIKKKYPNHDIRDGMDFKDFSIINKDVYYKDELLNLDIYFWYSHIDLSYDSYNLNVLKQLTQNCKVIKNPFAEEIGIDKFKSHQLLKANNIGVADHALVSSRNLDFAEKLLKKWKSIVVKPRLGNYGVGVMLIKNFSTLRDLFGVIKETKNKEEISLLLEKFYLNDINEWTSVVLFGNKTIYGYRKKLNKFVEGWKVFDDNKVQGDSKSVDYVKPSKDLKKIAEKASKVMKADIIGFDFIKTNEGFKLIDENTKPGFYDHCFKKSKVPIEDAFMRVL